MRVRDRISRRKTRRARGSSTVGETLEADVQFQMVDFYAEHQELMRLGLARSPRDVNTMKFYRITSQQRRVLAPDNCLVIRHARVLCQGKALGLGCDGEVQVSHALLPSPEGHLLLHMRGVLDALSKWPVTCTCGTEFLVYADATVGAPQQAYLVVVTTRQPESARLGITPFFEADGIDVIEGPIR